MLIFLLPCYNEAEALPKLLDEIRHLCLSNQIPYHIVAVNDGSADSTRSVLSGWPKESNTLSLVNHDANRGLGAAIRSGVRRSLELGHPGDVVVALDADGTHDPTYALAMLEKVERGSDLVIASRFVRGGAERGVPPFRRALSRLAGRFAGWWLKIPGVTDYTCGFRGYRFELLQKLLHTHGDRLITENGFACMVELLTKASASGAKITEIPFCLHYDRKPGASKMRIFPTVRRTLAVLWRYGR